MMTLKIEREGIAALGQCELLVESVTVGGLWPGGEGVALTAWLLSCLHSVVFNVALHVICHT